MNGIDTNHVHRLADIYPCLPPVLVHRPTMRVVDGMHRIGAAALRGLTSVAVHFFDGTEEEVFLRSVSANTSHGLPLSLADRKAAAQRILDSHPSLSDRAVAGYVGLDAKTVAALRQCSAADSPPLNARMGADGRVYPLDRTAERMHAAELLTRDPSLPLRTVVKETGLSLGTAHDVRQRLLRGDRPVPESRPGRARPAGAGGARTGDPAKAASSPAGADAPGTPRARPSAHQLRTPRSRGALDALRRLAADPSLRHSDSGRDFIRWIHVHFVMDEAWRKRLDTIPPHCTESVAELAQECADSWRRFADELSRKRHVALPVHPEMRATRPSRH